jgi:hypothetical protein
VPDVIALEGFQLFSIPGFLNACHRHVVRLHCVQIELNQVAEHFDEIGFRADHSDYSGSSSPVTGGKRGDFGRVPQSGTWREKRTHAISA